VKRLRNDAGSPWEHTSAYVSIRQHTPTAVKRVRNDAGSPSGRRRRQYLCTFVLVKQVTPTERGTFRPPP
jgi:hypothetical protein